MANIIKTESWAQLIKEAKNMGLTPADVRAFLQKKQMAVTSADKEKCL